ncbi:hypothetical protein CXB51_000809 [Gossypium anomalum]|uniref:Reverse transcriptase Ty1/copia-type domain-containing protein n=1 Tax=Gossypium anomalum TaxID=47600 RepID=A0A8J5ZJL3_9ROSI|nr:hypothetical protein CXB51_000809 [Gossypium anomalum]
MDSCVPRGPHALNPFVQNGNGQCDNVDPNSYGNGLEFDIGQNAMVFQFNDESLGHSYVKMASKPRGPSGSVRSRLTDGQFVVDSSPYDSSQFVGLPPRLPELHASDYSDSTTYDSNFNSTDSYVPLPVGNMSYAQTRGLLITYAEILQIYMAPPHIQGQVRDGLYQFSAGSNILSPSVHSTNGVAERKHRHIVETGFTLLAQANLPMKYWGYAFCSAIHLINRLPTPVLKGRSPYQSLFAREPTYDHLRVFDGKVIVSRHVFYENQFLFSLSSSTGNQTSLGNTMYIPIVRSFTTGGTRLHLEPASGGSLARTIVREKDISTAAIPVKSVTILIVSTTNAHSMVTRSKVSIFKPKALCADNVEVVPSSVEEALAHQTGLCKWLFKIKKNPDRTINRRKARLVAKGCSQVLGYDFKETFNLVVKPATIRVILFVVVTKGWPLRQVDQAPRAWFNKLKQFLVSTGFTLSKSDTLLFVRSSSDYTLYVLVYVDDIVITGSSFDEINYFVQQVHNKFALKDIGDLHYFLGIEVSRSSSGSLHLCQRKYIWKLLEQSSMSNAKNVHTLMVSSSVLSKDEGECLVDPTDYCSLTGALQYIILTRPDIVYAVNRWLSLVGYVDANWGLAFDDRRSTTGYCMYFGHTPISWCSKKQQVISRSTVEAEYRSLATATSDVAWLVSLLTELKLSSADPLTVWCDNSSAVAVAAKPVLHSKFKHVELDLFFVRKKVVSGELIVGEVLGCDQVADILTKPLSISMFTRFRHLLQVILLEEVG